jgi:hypothetical protein
LGCVEVLPEISLIFENTPLTVLILCEIDEYMLEEVK